MAANLVIALDVDTRAAALELAKALVPATPWMKVGLELFTVAGPEVVSAIKRLGGRVFLDLKFHDIPNTAAHAVKSAIKSGADICDVHLSGGEAMCRAAADAAREGGGGCLVFGVTVLTSIAPEDVAGDMSSMVVNYALKAKTWGLDGVVCSGQEAAAVKKATQNEILCLCPGIRPAGFSGDDDQRRVVTAPEAVRAGADFIVVGRPVTRAADPLSSARAIIGSFSKE